MKSYPDGMNQASVSSDDSIFNGDCWNAAYDLFFSSSVIRGLSCRGLMVYICHGIVCGQGKLSGLYYKHAWVEVENPDSVGDFDAYTVYEFSNDRDITMPCGLYYCIGNIDPELVFRYSREEAIDAMRRLSEPTKGPWCDYLLNYQDPDPFSI